MIEVKNLVKKYSDHAAVDNLSFTLEKGHVLGFLGPNGAGKSTLGNTLMGNPIYNLSSGKIIFDGRLTTNSSKTDMEFADTVSDISDITEEPIIIEEA